MYRRVSILLCGLFALCGLSRCHADSYALLIGIDAYSQNDAINGLAGASNDAKALAKTLEDVGGLPADHVRLLTSDGDTKPSVANITFELDQLSQEAKPGDVVFVLFSGHGIDIDGNTYLVPWDADARTESTLKRTSLLETDVRDQLSKISARALVMAFDMCRSDPRKGERGVAQDNVLKTRQAKDLVIQPAKDQTGATGPRAVVTLFSCSPGERSWEWASKDRGYFSYYLEKGLRHDAANAKGQVSVSSLVSYLEKAVPGAVKKQEGHDQTPSSNLEGNGAGDLILARVTPGAILPDNTTATMLPTAPAVDTLQVRVQQTLTQGKALLDLHNWSDAQLKYGTALELQPQSAEAMYGLGMSYAGLKRWDDAAKEFQQAHTLAPKMADPVNGLALIAFKNHHYADSERLLRQAQALEPKNPDVLENLGYLNLLVKHDAAVAEPFFRQAIALEPKNSDHTVGLGLVYLQKNDRTQAERYLRKALEFNPRNSQAAQALGILLMAGGDTVQSEQWLRNAIDFDPTDAGPVTYLANLTFNFKHDKGEAERLYKKAKDLDPLDAEPLIGLSALYLANDDPDKAYQYARNAMDVDPSASDPLVILAAIAVSHKDFPTAESYCRKAIALNGTSGNAYAVLAKVLAEEGRSSEAMAAARKAISLGSK